MTEHRLVTFDPNLLKYIRLRKNDLARSLLTPDLCKACDEYGTLLHYAVQGKNAWLVDTLLRLGSPVDAWNRRGQTALMMALDMDDVCIVEKLLSGNADIYVTNREGMNALEMLFYFRDLSDDLVCHFIRKMQREGLSMKEMIKKLIVARCSAYHAVQSKNRQLLEALLEHGVGVDSRGYHKRTALMAAARMEDVELVEFLLRKGADVNALDDDGKNALLSYQIPALRHPTYGVSETILQLLLEYGADVNVRSRQRGLTPLFNVYAQTDEGTESKRLANFLDTWAELLLLLDALPQNSTHDKILEYANKKPDSFRTQLLIAHVAMLELQGTPIILSLTGSGFEDYCAKYPKFGEYHDLCQRVLLMPIYDGLTLLELLYISERKMRAYVNDEDFAPKLGQFYSEQKLGVQCPLYYKKMEERVFKTTQMLELEDKTTSIFSKIFNANCNVIAREIISYLSKQDLKNFCQIDE